MIDPRWHIVAFTLAALLLRVVAARLTASHERVPQRALWLTRRSSTEGLRFAYYVGLPYTTLLLGILPARYLGLIGLERLSNLPTVSGADRPLEWLHVALSLLLQSWLPDLGHLAGTSALMAVLLAVVWSLYRHYATTNADAVAVQSQNRILASWARQDTFVGAAYAALHWAFYRAAIWWLTDDLYLGVVGGVVLILVEAWLCYEMNAGAALEVSWLIATATVFYFAPNLWLLIPVHWLLTRMCRPIVAGSPLMVAPS